jgi:hypothetical protein
MVEGGKLGETLAKMPVPRAGFEGEDREKVEH